MSPAFCDALRVDFATQGAAAIARLREEDPAAYLHVCASIDAAGDGADARLSDDALLARIRALLDEMDALARPRPRRRRAAPKGE